MSSHLSTTETANLFPVSTETAKASLAGTDLRQRVQLFLATSNLPGLRHLQIDVDENIVTLRGRLHTFYEKQLAVRLSRRVAGVIRVVDLIEVRSYSPPIDLPRSPQRRLADGPPGTL